MGASAVKRRKIIHGNTYPFIGVEDSALPAINGTLDSDGILPFAAEGTDAVQNLFLDTATSGTYVITYYDYRGIAYSTTALAFDATNSAIELALEALTAIGTGNVSVVADGADFTITFDGADVTAKRPQLLMIIDGTNLIGAGAEAITTTTAGVANWISAGFIENGVEIEYTPGTEPKRVDNFNAPLLNIIFEEDGKVIFEMAERDVVAFNQALAASTVVVQKQASGTPGQIMLGIGDATQEIVSMAFQGTSPEGFPRLWWIPSCTIVGPFTNKDDKKANNVTVEVSILANPCQAAGQTMIHVYDMTAAALA